MLGGLIGLAGGVPAASANRVPAAGGDPWNKAMSLIVVLTALPARSFAIPFLEVIAQWTIAVICSVTVSSGRGSAQAGRPGCGRRPLPCPGGATGGDRGDAGGDAFGARV